MPQRDREGMDRRGFGTTIAGAGTALALASHLRGAPSGSTETRTLFFNLSHENHEGHEYALVVGKSRHILQRATGSHPAMARARRRSTLMNALPANAITHVLENIRMPARAVQASYLQKDADPVSGTWGMTAIYVLPPKASYWHAYQRARALTPDGPLPLSAKRRKYGLPPALTFQDLLEEQDVVDLTNFATALVNLHPELLSAEPNSAAHIQTNHIQTLQSLGDVHDALECAGTALPQGQTGVDPCGSLRLSPRGTGADNPTGWATLVPYTDENNIPLKSSSPNTKGLILYDAKWQPKVVSPWISTAMTDASKRIKSDEASLGKDVTAGRTKLTDDDLTGRIWFRNDGVTSIDQSSRQMAVSDNASFTLSNITRSYGGYSVDADVTLSGSDANVSLKYKNWYLRWLGLYIQFLKADGSVVPSSELPGISRNSGLDTANNELFVGILTPEFTVFGVPVQASGNSLAFTFPKTASSAKILASGLGMGSHTFQDTETVGIVMTSIFNLSIPMFLLAFGLGSSVDAFYKLVAIPSALGVVQFIAAVAQGATDQQIGAIIWRSIVRGIANPSGLLKEFLEAFIAFLAEAEIIESFEDAIPIVGAILQAIGALGVLAEVAETSCEVVLSPWTYQYDLVGTHDLAVTILPDPKDKAGFPAAAATYKVTAIFDNGTPQVQMLSMPGGAPQSLKVEFKGVPLGGNVAVNVGFYTQDSTQVGHGSQGAKNDVGSSVTITITEDQLPITSGTTYRHKRKTTLDAQGNHVWACSPPPGVPETQSMCQPSAGNLCSFREITVSALGYVGYGWQSFSNSPCQGAPAQLDQLANIPVVNGGSGNAQSGYALTSCSLGGAARLIYDPLGRSDRNFFIDTTQNGNLVRQVDLSSPHFDPTNKMAWGVFTLSPTDALLHPAGAIVTINSANHRMETLKLPTKAMADADAAVNLLATLHAGQGTRPGLFDAPTVSAITPEGTVVIIESGNNRMHAVDISGNPVQLFRKQTPEPYFLTFSETGGPGTQYLDVAAEFSGFIYVLSFKNPVYRLDIYHRDQTGTAPISTTMGFNAAKIAVDYWRNVYSLNYEVIRKIDKSLPAVTEPSISQWIPTAPPPCQAIALNITSPADRRRLLRRRTFWKASFV